MGETACLMQPFSYVSGIPNEDKEGNPIHALGQSISFGRFMSESLSWEKWSTFPHKKYVEEAERYSRPGSVAEKKAFFEAHYKKIAERKAAALLEQAQNNASKNVPESESEDGVNNVTTEDSQMIPLNPQQEVSSNGHDINITEDKSEGNKVEAPKFVNENKVLVEKNVNLESTKQICIKVEALSRLGVDDRATQMGKSQLKSLGSKKDEKVSISKKKPTLSSSNSSGYSKVTKVPPSPARPAALSHSKKENNSTPINKKPAIDLAEKKRSTPKSSHKSIYFTPAREINRLTSTIIRKIDSSKVAANAKASKDCSTPLKTPTAASVSGATKHPLTTPWSENRRAGMLHESSASGNKTVRARWQFLPTENKLQSPNSSTPFRLRTEERAARRKEKLEEKFNANQAQKIQQQATLKEKAETELKKLRQSLCFKARPLPNFYKERSASKNEMKKVTLTQTQPPKEGKSSTSGTVQIKVSQPSKKSSTNNMESNCFQAKKGHNSDSLNSRPTRLTHENTSPNIQPE
ncbi:protein WVD2-like 7 isoform X2 [Mangifera indica]|uniref:protein WVD2-like 7 isoform X2 n=1 Tax=Mangifera indica TaxID=29780 RepID=UPI001CFB7609|nr:protein WVD2-like 7 isoform X2 [Mangifera indica]